MAFDPLSALGDAIAGVGKIFDYLGLRTKLNNSPEMQAAAKKVKDKATDDQISAEIADKDEEAARRRISP